MAGKRGRPRKIRPEDGGGQAAAPTSLWLQIVKKKVLGDNQAKHFNGDRLEVGKDVSRETAALFIEKGLAIDITGKLQADINEEKGEAADRNRMIQQKSRAEAEMARHDRMTEDDRQFALYRDPEEGADIGDDEDSL